MRSHSLGRLPADTPRRAALRTAEGAPRGYITRPLPVSRSHGIAYAGLWLYSAILIFQPGELNPGLAFLARISFAIAAFTLFACLVSQIWFERRLTAWTREMTLVTMLSAAALVSVAWSTNQTSSMAAFTDVFIKSVLMFIVMVNVIRTEKRLLWFFWLVLGAAGFLSWGAVNSFRTGNFTIEGYRVQGALGGNLADPNDSALFLVTMIPIAIALLLSSRARMGQLLYGLITVLMTAAIFVTYSRGGFLALSFAGTFLAWKFFRRSPRATAAVVSLGLLAIVLLLPSNYTARLASIANPDLDPHASASAREHLLERSIEVTGRYPLLGVGMDNFHFFSIRDQATHNAYTQVSAEMGIPAMLIYIAFVVSPFGRLRRIERETEGISRTHEGYRRCHLLAIGLQASLIGFMVGSFFLSVAYYWFIYYLIGYAICLGRLYETGLGRIVGTYEVEDKTQ